MLLPAFFITYVESHIGQLLSYCMLTTVNHLFLCLLVKLKILMFILFLFFMICSIIRSGWLGCFWCFGHIKFHCPVCGNVDSIYQLINLFKLAAEWMISCHHHRSVDALHSNGLLLEYLKNVKLLQHSLIDWHDFSNLCGFFLIYGFFMGANPDKIIG